MAHISFKKRCAFLGNAPKNALHADLQIGLFIFGEILWLQGKNWQKPLKNTFFWVCFALQQKRNRKPPFFISPFYSASISLQNTKKWDKSFFRFICCGQKSEKSTKKYPFLHLCFALAQKRSRKHPFFISPFYSA